VFTGLVQATGAIVSVRPLQTGVHIEVDAAGLAPRAIAPGDSIAVSGVCLTVTTLQDGRFGADVSRETLSRTSGLDGCRTVNLEAALALGDRLGGHLVTGHIDGVGTVMRFAPAGESVELVVRAPAPLGRLLAVKGSVAIDGVSLTINSVRDVADPVPAAPGAAAERACDISINLIPHTVAVTTLRELAAGMQVNLEVDLIARYVARMLGADAYTNAHANAQAYSVPGLEPDAGTEIA
jgi:riboflavin synthase